MDSEDLSFTREKADGALTIDLEDWHSALYPTRKRAPNHTRGINEDLIRNSTRALMEQLNIMKTKATFFIVGDVARAVPEIVKEILRRGHEIGSHSPMHVQPHTLPRSELIRMIGEDVEFFQELTGLRPLGFRVPYFAMGRNDGWLLEALSDLGFKYDSSVVPTWTPLYGIPHAPKSPYFPSFSDIAKPELQRRIIEFPVSVWPSWRGVPGLPMGGGFFLRAWPVRMTKFVLGMNRNAKLPLILYLHLGDLDTNKERMGGMSIPDKTIQYFGAKNGMPNLRALLREFKLSTISEVFSSELQAMDMSH